MVIEGVNIAQFNAPSDILARNYLSSEDKVQLLRQWEFDIREREVAEEENMGSSQVDILDEILAALHQLNAQPELRLQQSKVGCNFITRSLSCALFKYLVN